MDSLRNRLLSFYGLKEGDYESFVAEPDPNSIPTLDNEEAAIEALRILNASIEAGQKILIYGDYDTDGIMATSIIKRALLLKGVEAKHFIPSRYIDAYGLTLNNAIKIAESGYGLVILVDNGVSCFEGVSHLREKGINVLIIDHHDLPASLPPANAIIHDELLRYGSAPVSAGFLCYLFSALLLGKSDPYLFSLGALSLLSDVMPMKGQNRTAVSLLLRTLRKEEFPEIFLLTSKKYVDEKILNLEVIPKINAVPRVKTGHEPNRLVDYFASLEGKGKFAVAEWAKAINEERKAIQKSAYESLYLEEAPGYCIKGNLPEGLNGLLANKVLSEKKKPCVVFSASMAEQGCLVGSFRSKEGAEFSSLMPLLGSLPLKSGGHAYAGGITIREKDFPVVEAIFRTWAEAHPIVEKEKESIELLLSEVNMDTYREIRKFGPFGEGHREPTFLIKDVPTAKLRFMKEGKFMKTPLAGKASLLSFKLPQSSVTTATINLKGSFSINEFNGTYGLDFVCEKAG